jgi:hypothetical protein
MTDVASDADGASATPMCTPPPSWNPVIQVTQQEYDMYFGPLSQVYENQQRMEDSMAEFRGNQALLKDGAAVIQAHMEEATKRLIQASLHNSATASLSVRATALALGQCTRDYVSMSTDFLAVFNHKRCAHCLLNPRVTYNDDDDDHTGFLDDTTLCSHYPDQCWFKTHNLFINRFNCALSRQQPTSEDFASHGYSCPCIAPSKYIDTSLNEHVKDYLQFLQYVVLQ